MDRSAQIREFSLGNNTALPHPFKPFGWKGAQTPQEQLGVEFVQSLPPSPLRAHLASLYAMYVHEQMFLLRWIDQSVSATIKAEAEKEMAERLALFEQHLRQVATYTQINPYEARRIVEAATKPKPPRPRREFRKKEPQ